MVAEPKCDSLAAKRHDMVEIQLRRRGIRDERVLAAMGSIPRHEFVDAPYRDEAYHDYPLPIDSGQTISQPYIVALMLEPLQLNLSSRVLEIGTGSGYQTALLAQLAAHVYSVERHAGLARRAADTLARLGLTNVNVVTGDGTRGLPEFAPFDAIVVAAAASKIPPALIEQLREGGRMVIPVGSSQQQELLLVEKRAGKILISSREWCRFVPLISDTTAP